MKPIAIQRYQKQYKHTTINLKLNETTQFFKKEVD